MTPADERRTDSGIELRPVYTADDLAASGFEPERDLGQPGEYPFTRGVYPTMYRSRLWTMRQYAGMATADETNARFRYLLAQGQTGISVAFDLPTQMGLDSDHPRAEGEVGKTGVAIDSVDDMARLLEGIPLDRVSTSMTINATAPILLLLYELVAEEHGRQRRRRSAAPCRTTSSRSTRRAARTSTRPAPSMRLITDLFAYCGERVPRWNTISISGYHMREAGSTAAQEIAFTLADGIAYVQAALDAGLDDRRVRAAPVVLLRLPHALLRGGREVPRGPAHVGAHHARALRRDGPAELDAAVPHADRRRHAHGAAARGQHRAHRARGARRGARRHAVAAHELLRRGARAADRAQRHDRAAHAAGHRLRDRRDRDRRSGRRLVLRRVAHRRARAARRRSTSRRSTRWAAPCARSRPGSTRTRSTRRRSASSRAWSRGSGSWWA